MAEFKKPKILKESGKLKSKDGSFIIQIKHLEYEVDDNKYPKLNLSSYRVDQDGFPTERPKVLNLPIDMSEEISKAILSLIE